MRKYLLGLNIVNALIFIWIVVIFNSIFDFEKVVTNADDDLAAMLS